jgi:hypothetical protein
VAVVEKNETMLIDEDEISKYLKPKTNNMIKNELIIVANNKQFTKEIQSFIKKINLSCPSISVNSVNSHVYVKESEIPHIIIVSNDKLLMSENLLEADVSEIVSLTNWKYKCSNNDYCGSTSKRRIK